MFNSDELIGTTEYLMLQTRCRINTDVVITGFGCTVRSYENRVALNKVSGLQI